MSETEFQQRIKKLREQTGLSRKEFCERYGIPYRTMTDWELGNRVAPDYVIRLLTYYVQMERINKISNEIKNS
ncbi:MAG: helix-turn-helix transcriptional regulator [Faecalimonas sp.]|nr:helix-turn-helix transcriptional regulator [Faecalimonas sp.]